VTVVKLREVADEDVEVFFEHQRDPEAVDLVVFKPRGWADHVAHWDRIRADPGTKIMTILVDDSVVGNIVSWQAEEHRELGYWLGREQWGRGIATDAVRAFLDLERSRPLYAYVAEHNIASLRVLEKCGFAAAGRAEEDGVVRTVMVLR
jgi:RimJ/RimL family protein N-acetyltransferase